MWYISSFENRKLNEVSSGPYKMSSNAKNGNGIANDVSYGDDEAVTSCDTDEPQEQATNIEAVASTSKAATQTSKCKNARKVLTVCRNPFRYFYNIQLSILVISTWFINNYNWKNTK